MGTCTQTKFLPITAEDKKTFDGFYNQRRYPGSEANFTNAFVWQDLYNIRYTIYDGFLILTGRCPEMGDYYVFPVGTGDIRSPLHMMDEHYRAMGREYTLRCLTKEQTALVEDAMPGHFEFKHSRGSDDYIYEIDKMIALTGKKYNSKRNHLNRFLRTYDYTYHKITTTDDIVRCLDAACRLTILREDENLEDELASLGRMFDNYTSLGLTGAYIEIDGQIAAVTVGEAHHEDVLIHVEKGDIQYHGIYPAINQLFLKNEWQGYRYVNREEDLGLENLRKAKLSYHPAFLLEKYIGHLEK